LDSEELDEKPVIFRKFKSFVLRDSIENSSRMRERISVLESIEEFLSEKEANEVISYYKAAEQV